MRTNKKRKNMITNDVIVGNEYSAIQRGREVFTGKLVSIRDIVGREHKFYRLEDERGNYCTFFANDTDFINPADKPKFIPQTTEELNIGYNEYLTSVNSTKIN
jgi:hypothetical protein